MAAGCHLSPQSRVPSGRPHFFLQHLGINPQAIGKAQLRRAVAGADPCYLAGDIQKLRSYTKKSTGPERPLALSSVACFRACIYSQIAERRARKSYCLNCRQRAKIRRQWRPKRRNPRQKRPGCLAWGLMPRCWYPLEVTRRPRGVRWSSPSCMRKGS